MIKKSLIIFAVAFSCITLFACDNPNSSRTSNVKQVIESRAQNPNAAPNDFVSNNSEMKKSAAGNPTPQKVLKVDLDLSPLNSVVCDAYLRQLQENKEQYKGIVIKAKGTYNYYKNQETNKEYYNCVFASTCCPNGLEFILADSTKYPKEQGEQITVIGQFDYYDEDGVIYYNLVNATLV